MRSAQGEGRTVDEAVDAALIELGESRRNVDVKVLKETADEVRVEVVVLEAPSGGAGLGPDAPAPARRRPLAAGPAPAQPAATRRAGEHGSTSAGGASLRSPGVGGAAQPAPAAPAPGSPPEPAGAATGDSETVRILVRQLLDRMGINADVSSRETEESILVDISGRDLGMLIGWRGETLRALQTMTNLLASRHVAPERRVVVDVEQYRRRRENTVREMAERAATQVKATGEPITLDAMQPFERRAIHVALQSDPGVSTGSIGEEPDRRVVVSPVTSEG